MAAAKFIGVFSCNSWPAKTTSSRKSNWFVWEDDWGRYRVQLLDAAYQPLDAPRVITTPEFKRHFTAQPKILVTPLKQLELGSQEEDEANHAAELEKARRVKQDIAELSSQLGIEVEPEPTLPATVLGGAGRTTKIAGTTGTTGTTGAAGAAGTTGANQIAGANRIAGAAGVAGTAGTDNLLDELQRMGAPGAAGVLDEANSTVDEPVSRHDFERAAQLDTETRTDFALALTRWRRGDKDRSMVAFKSILKLQSDILPVHKHMFTDFAIDLRKCALTSLAKEFYRRAVALAPDDCNALFNLARIYFETGEIHSAVDTLDKALELEQDFDYALRFRRYLYTNYPKQLRTTEDGSPKTKSAANASDFRLRIER